MTRTDLVSETGEIESCMKVENKFYIPGSNWH